MRKDEDFKHFLPRICELLFIDYSGPDFDFDNLLGKLEIANWESWNEDEKNAIQKFLITFVETLGSCAVKRKTND